MENPAGDGGGDGAAGLGESFLGAPYIVSEGQEDADTSDGDRGNDEPMSLREQDRFLPIANVARIMKKSIPKTGKIAKDAKECVQECVSEFISFITSEASERCHQEKRKTINGEDILFAMSNLGFDNHVEPLKLYLQKYRESTKGEKGMVVSQGEGLEDLTGATEDAFAHGLTGSILTTDQSGQQSVIYTAAFANQVQYVLRLVTVKHVREENIAILTQYRGQREEIRRRLGRQHSKVAVRTVRDSHASEWELVVFSTVRSLPKEKILRYPSKGWAKRSLGRTTDQNEINVALTRSRKGLAIFGNKDLLKCDPMWQELLKYYEERRKIVDATSFVI